jgi:class 3 adenylate cyclase
MVTAAATISKPERRLAAVVAIDVVGFSRLMGRDEAGTLANLKARRKEVAEPARSEDF